MKMQEVFDKLRALQEVLSEKFRIEREMDEIPKVLATKTELLSRLKMSYLEKTADHEAKGKRIEELRNSAIEAERKRENFEKQMDMIQTQREYEALDKEIKDSGEKEQELRRELQREEQLQEEMKVNLQKEETMIKKQETEVTSEQKRIKDELKARQTELNNLKKVEKKITPGLDEEILFKFERIIRSKSGLGIVGIEHGVCTGCHMILTGQYVNDVREGNKIMFCPNCSRILFFTEEQNGESLLPGDTDEDVEDTEDMEDAEDAEDAEDEEQEDN
jgi:predicted  nucleic acid-binding Zn-ribbon protein